MNAKIGLRKRRGFALILVMGQITLLLFFWSIANRQTGQLIQTAEVLKLRAELDHGSLTAIAAGVALMETGFPSTSPFTGSVESDGRTYLVTFTDLTDGTWGVSASRAPLGDTTDPLPTTFAMEPPE